MKARTWKVGQLVKDRWYEDWGIGTVSEVSKRYVSVVFPNHPDAKNGAATGYDHPHANQFLLAVMKPKPKRAAQPGAGARRAK